MLAMANVKRFCCSF